jgi:hypothetical protein
LCGGGSGFDEAEEETVAAAMRDSEGPSSTKSSAKQERGFSSADTGATAAAADAMQGEGKR